MLNYMSLGLVLCLVLHNNSIHARSHPSAGVETSSVPLTRATLQHPRHQHMQQHQTRQQRDRQSKHISPDPSNKENKLQQQRDGQRLRRHLRQQQERSYYRVTSEQLKTSPKLWQLHSQGNQFDQFLDSKQMLQDASEAEDQTVDLMLNDNASQHDVKNELFLSLVEPAPPVVIKEEAKTLNATKSASSGCPKCDSSRQVEHISEEELRRLRIEFVKQQILEKLRLKESPKVSAVELPRPIFEGITLQHADKYSKNKDYDDYYARTNQKFILLQREKAECRRLSAHPSICFSFKIDDADADGFDVSSAVLWLYKNKQNYTKASNESQLNDEQNKQTIVVSELEQQLLFEYLPLAKTIAIQSVDVQAQPTL